MTQRLSIEEAKSYWFGDDLTVCAIDGHGNFWGALPRREVMRGFRYLKRLENCKTIEQAQLVYEGYVTDPEAPKLLPCRLVDFHEEADLILEYLENALQKGSQQFVSLKSKKLKQMSNVQLFDLIKHEPFNLHESKFYMDESDMNVIYAQSTLVTDSWIPLEIAEMIGIPDVGESFFYETVEFIYPDFNKFSEAFRDLGLEVVANRK
jgi:hypothetical protein